MTDEQYNDLLTQENSFDTLINQGWCRNLNYTFLSKMKEIYADVFNEPPLNINCSGCVNSAMHRLWPLMQEKKAEYKRIEEDRVIQETIRIRDESNKRKTYQVLVNGKPKSEISIHPDSTHEQIEAAVLANDGIKKLMGGRVPKEIIFVKSSIVNILL